MTDVPHKALPYTLEQLDVLRPRAKAALRKRYRGLRASLPPGAGAVRSQALCARVIALDAWQAARTVAVFRAMPDEVDTAALIAEARARGCTVCLPVVVDGRGELEFRVAWRGDEAFALEAGVWGIEEPAAGAPVVPPDAIDLVVVPALAIDGAGHRLGYGRGYYDQTLVRTVNAVTVGVAFDFQLIAEVPFEAHDVPVAWVVTDQRTLRASSDDGRDPPENR